MTRHHQAPGRCWVGVVRLIPQFGPRGTGPRNSENRKDGGVAAKERDPDRAVEELLCLKGRPALPPARRQEDPEDPLSRSRGRSSRLSSVTG